MVNYERPDSWMHNVEAFSAKSTILKFPVGLLFDLEKDCSGGIVLIRDGEETCNADPCALVREWGVNVYLETNSAISPRALSSRLMRYSLS